MSISRQLRAMQKPALIALVGDLYGRDGDIDEIIKSHLEQQGTEDETDAGLQPSLLPYLQRQVTQLISSTAFIDYRSAHPFSQQLEQLLADIGDLAEQHAAQALALLDQLLEQHGTIYERVDDSDGYLGDALGNAVELWLAVATILRSEQPEARDWVGDVCTLYDNNDYGCVDDIISISSNLLSIKELRELAERFEHDARVAIDRHKGNDYNEQAAHACMRLSAVAQALSDINLYEQATLLTTPQPNLQQLQDLINYALSIKALERAEYWLQQPQWQVDQRRHAQLSNRLLEHQGNITQLKHNLLQAFQQEPSEHNLRAYWQHAEPDERQVIGEQVLEQAKSLKSASEAIRLLLFIGSIEMAAEYFIAHHAKLKGSWYGTLLGWLEPFEAAEQTLASILCYRLLLADLLDRGYSKAYHHGARYFHSLLKLDKKQPDYRGLDNAQAYITALQAKHGRKRSFWDAAGYPNKAVVY